MCNRQLDAQTQGFVASTIWDRPQIPHGCGDIPTPALRKEQRSQNKGPAAFLFPEKPQDCCIPRLLEGKEKLPSERIQDFPESLFHTHLPSLQLPAALVWAQSDKSGSTPACSAGTPLELAHSSRNARTHPLQLQGTRKTFGDIWQAGFPQINPIEVSIPHRRWAGRLFSNLLPSTMATLLWSLLAFAAGKFSLPR